MNGSQGRKPGLKNGHVMPGCSEPRSGKGVGIGEGFTPPRRGEGVRGAGAPRENFLKSKLKSAWKLQQVGMIRRYYSQARPWE